ncbi:MAG TPA: glutathione synthase [Myxococcota bacterium]|nr:glutathione synthase [Myxococcota bacterium]
MALTFAFVMDPIERVNIRTDTSFAFMLAACGRGHRVLHVAPQDIALVGSMPHLTGRQLEVYDRLGDHFRVIEKVRVEASACDAIMIRTDPPFDAAYLTVTWMLSLAEEQGVRIINSPAGIRSANEKMYALNFVELCPDTIVTASREDIRAFVAAHGDQAIAKPLDGHGGYGVVRLRQGDSNLNAVVDLLTQEGKRPIVVQQFLPEAAQGDKRLLMVDGEIRGAVRRVPRQDDHRGNVHVGGRAEACELTAADHAIGKAMGDRLRADKLFFVGLDVIGDKLIEVNVTSPTLVQELRNLGGPDLAKEVIDAVEKTAGR